MERVLTDFVKALRNVNIRVSPAETLDATEVLEKVGLQFYKFDTYDEDDKKYNWYQILKKQYSTPT